jgi:predicted phosphoribosyltransferase
MAAPVGARESCEAMRSEADEVLCLRQPPFFYAVGAHYDHFETVEDAEVIQILDAYMAANAAPTTRVTRSA